MVFASEYPQECIRLQFIWIASSIPHLRKSHGSDHFSTSSARAAVSFLPIIWHALLVAVKIDVVPHGQGKGALLATGERLWFHLAIADLLFYHGLLHFPSEMIV